MTAEGRILTEARAAALAERPEIQQRISCYEAAARRAETLPLEAAKSFPSLGPRFDKIHAGSGGGSLHGNWIPRER